MQPNYRPRTEIGAKPMIPPFTRAPLQGQVVEWIWPPWLAEHSCNIQAASTIYRKVLVQNCCCHEDPGPQTPFLLGESPELLNLPLTNLLQGRLQLYSFYHQTSLYKWNIPVVNIYPQVFLCLCSLLFASASEASSEPASQMLPSECHGFDSHMLCRILTLLQIFPLFLP